MKELYISPELEIVSFAALQQLAGTWGTTYGITKAGSSSNVDSTPEATGDYNEPVTPEEGL